MELILENACLEMELPLSMTGTYRYPHCRRDQWLSVGLRHAPRFIPEETCLFDATVDLQWLYSTDTKEKQIGSENDEAGKKVSPNMPNVRDTLVPIWKSTPK